MDLKQIEKLMIAMGRHGMKRVMIKKEEFELELEKDTGEVSRESLHGVRLFNDFAQDRPIPYDYGPKQDASSANLSEKNNSQDTFITSPLVGTFYVSPSPDSPSFVKVGDMVTEDTVVCIVEAMKVMNEVKAGVSGRIEEVMIANGDPVQFGSQLFRIVRS